MGSFTQWLAGLFGAARAETIEQNGYRYSADGDEVPLLLEKMAIQSAVGLVAAAVGQCRFRTFLEGEELKGEEYYLWNYSPNMNQNSTQFIQDFVETLMYDNEALVVERRGQMFIADSFSYHEQGTEETVFCNITVNGEALADRKARDVLFFRLHNMEVHSLLASLCHQYEELIAKAVKSYEKTAADKGIVNVDTAKRGTFDYEKYEEDLYKNKFKKFFSAKDSVLPLHAGYTYTPHTKSLRNTSEINDVKNMTDEIYNRVGQAFRIPPAFLRGEAAQNKDGMEHFLEFCVRPISNMLEEEITRKRYGIEGVTKKSFVLVDTSMVEICGLFASADKLDKIIGSGILSIDEVREKSGEVALETEESQMHFVTKNYGQIDVQKGEQDEK